MKKPQLVVGGRAAPRSGTETAMQTLCSVVVALAASSVAEPPGIAAAAQQTSQVHVHVAHVATGFNATPAGRGLARTASTEGGIAMLHANLAVGAGDDLDAMKRHAGHVLHALEPAEGSRGPGTGFGLKRAVDGVATHIGLAANAPGASANVRTHAEHIATIARTVSQRAEEAAAVARRIQAASSASAARPLVEQLHDLAYQIAQGKDLNGDDRLALDGEAGLQQMEAHIYLLLEGESLPRIIQ